MRGTLTSHCLAKGMHVIVTDLSRSALIKFGPRVKQTLEEIFVPGNKAGIGSDHLYIPKLLNLFKISWIQSSSRQFCLTLPSTPLYPVTRIPFVAQKWLKQRKIDLDDQQVSY